MKLLRESNEVESSDDFKFIRVKNMYNETYALVVFDDNSFGVNLFNDLIKRWANKEKLTIDKDEVEWVNELPEDKRKELKKFILYDYSPINVIWFGGKRYVPYKLLSSFTSEASSITFSLYTLKNIDDDKDTTNIAILKNYSMYTKVENILLVNAIVSKEDVLEYYESLIAREIKGYGWNSSEDSLNKIKEIKKTLDEVKQVRKLIK